MSDPILPLGGASFDGLVSLREVVPQGWVSIRGDLSDQAIRDAVAGATLMALPGTRGVASDGDARLLWMAPDELAWLLPRPDAAGAADALADRLAAHHALVLDASDARAHFQLTGAPGAVREVLGKLAPVDLSPDAFPPMTLRRTRMAQMAAGVWFETAGPARVFCFRSVARYGFDLLCTAAAPHSAVGYY